MNGVNEVDVPWHVVKATIEKKLANDRAKLENQSATLEDVRLFQGRISLARELLELSKARGADRNFT